MTKGQQYRLKIDAYAPETMPLKVMSEYLSDLATLFGEESCTCPVVLVDWEAEPKSWIESPRLETVKGPSVR